MGKQSSYIPSGGFKEYVYHQVGATITANGLSGKVIDSKNGIPGHDGLPFYSNTSKIYFKMDDHGQIEQARIYDGRKAAFDLDWGHTHHSFEKGIVHVHRIYEDENGRLVWDRKMSVI